MITPVLLSIFATLALCQFPEYCSKPSAAIIGGVNMVQGSATDNKTSGYIDSAQVLSGINETICYKVSFNEDNVYRLYVIRYTGLTQHYPIKNSYQLFYPQLDTECFCQCGGAGDPVCSESRDHWDGVKESGEVRVNIHTDGQTNTGCLWMGGQTHSCCAVRITPARDDKGNIRKLGMVEVSTFETRPSFSITVLDLENGAVLNSYGNVTIGASGLLELDNITLLRVGFPGARQMLASGTYLVNQGVLHTGVVLNEPNEWDFNKLGWMKIETDTMVREEVLHSALHIKTLNCGENDFVLGFNGDYYLNAFPREPEYLKLGYPVVINDTGIIQSIKYSPGDRQIVVQASAAHRISISFYSNKKGNGATWLYDTALLGSFSATVRTDANSNTVLKLTLRDVVGGVLGYIQSTVSVPAGVVEEDISIQVSSYHNEYTAYAAIISHCEDIDMVCLKPSGARQVDYICLQRDKITCLFTQNTPDFWRPQLNYRKLSTSSNWRLNAWKQHGDPKELFDKEFRWEEGVMLGLYCLPLILLFILIIRCCVVWRITRHLNKPQSGKDAADSAAKQYPEGENIQITKCPTFEEEIQEQSARAEDDVRENEDGYRKTEQSGEHSI